MIPLISLYRKPSVYSPLRILPLGVEEEQFFIVVKLSSSRTRKNLTRRLICEKTKHFQICDLDIYLDIEFDLELHLDLNLHIDIDLTGIFHFSFTNWFTDYIFNFNFAPNLNKRSCAHTNIPDQRKTVNVKLWWHTLFLMKKIVPECQNNLFFVCAPKLGIQKTWW